MNIRLPHPIYTYLLIYFRKIGMTTKNSIGFIKFPAPLFRKGEGNDDAMIIRKRYFYGVAVLARHTSFNFFTA